MIWSMLFSCLCIIIGFLYFWRKIGALKKYQQELMNRNLELENQQIEYKQALECALNIYERLMLLLASHDIGEIWAVIFDYMEQVLKVKEAMLVEKVDTGTRLIYERNMERYEKEKILKQYSLLNNMKEEVSFQKLTNEFIVISIGDMNEYRGAILIKEQEVTKGICFVKSLCATILKQIKLEEMNQALLVNKEQNRIANEIHDDALQQLFGVQCHLYSLSKQVATIDTESLKGQLEEDRSIVQHIMGEIRKIIYGISWKRQGENYFTSKLQSYIKHMESLYEADIPLKIKGDIQLIPVNCEMALYRMICEGVANSLKHSQTDQVKIILEVSEKQVQLEIEDRGSGFDYQDVEEGQGFGLGIRNIKYLAVSMGGECHIASAKGKGTQILVVIPIGSAHIR